MDLDYRIEMTEQPAQPVLAMRFRTTVEKLPDELGKVYGAIIEYLNEIGEKPINIAYAAYYNMEMQDLDVEAGFHVHKPLAGKDEIKAGEIPAGKQVSCFYKGPYAQCENTYNVMMQWMKDNGYQPTGEVYEQYFNNPECVPESEVLTRVVFPIK